MTEHTPLPWTTLEDDDSWFVLDADENDICSIHSFRAHREADAELIVRACNSHDALIRALENIVAVGTKLITHGRLDSSNVGEAYSRADRIAREAISKARGE